MPTLPTLYPATPDGTATTMNAPVGAATYAQALQTNDGDTSYVTSGLDSSGSVFVNMDNMPADFDRIDTLTVSCVVKLQGTRADDTTQLYAQVFAADEATALTDEILVTDHTTGPTYTVDSTPLPINASGAGAAKAMWDGKKLRLRWVFAKSGKSDGIALRVTQAYLDGTYFAPNILPTARATATPNPAPDEVTPIALDGTTSSDPDGAIASYKWEKISGPAGAFDTPNAATCTFTPGAVWTGFSSDFTGVNGDPWDPAKWDRYMGVGAIIDIQNNQGRILSPASTLARAFSRDSAVPADQEHLFTVQWTLGVQYISYYFRSEAAVGVDSADPCYRLQWRPASTTGMWLHKRDAAGVTTTLANVSDDLPSDTTAKWWFRIRAVADQIQARWWQDGTAEPTTWGISVNDVAYKGPKIGLQDASSSETTTILDDLTISPAT